MIEAAVCALLISLGLGTWAFAVLCRRIYGRPRAPGARPDDSFLAKLFTPGPEATPVRVRADASPDQGRDPEAS